GSRLLKSPDGTPSVMEVGVGESGNHMAFDADFILHEYTHGLTHRVVGGRFDMHALDHYQSKAMAEGWSDFYALTIQNYYRLPGAEKVVFGAWVLGRPEGYRSFPYNDRYPRTYKHVKGMTTKYERGGVWCAALMQMCRNIRRVLNSDRDGYRLALKIVTDGLKLHANPSFIAGRDGILKALWELKTTNFLSQPVYESVRRSCWQAFAKFDMGYYASSSDGHNDVADLDHIVPDDSMPPDV